MSAAAPRPRVGPEGDRAIQDCWDAHGLYKPAPDLRRPVFSSVIPAPNPTGELHLGHALNLTIQDTLCRLKRLRGYETLWVGALDHGNFSTQTVVERRMAERGVPPRDATPDERRSEIEAWIREISPQILRQMRELGIVLDLAEPRSMGEGAIDRRIAGYFVELHEKGLIYAAEAVTDYCFTCRTSIDKADQAEEVVEQTLYTLVYRPTDGATPALRIETTDLATLHADVALAAAPGGPHARLLGRELSTGLGRRVTLYPCAELRPDAGAERITPAHSSFGFKFARAHGLSVQRAYSEARVMAGGPLEGWPVERAREELRRRLVATGSIDGQRTVQLSQLRCRKCGSVVEPFLSRQWFLSIEPMLEPTLKLLRDGDLRLHPARYGSLCRVWLQRALQAHRSGSLSEYSDDWCLSRQIECGNRLPVHRGPDGRETVELDPAPRDGAALARSTDVADMRLSCALWTFCANRTYTSEPAELQRIGRGAVCVTGVDLLFFWILPIAMLSTQLDDPLPFRDVVIHPVVCDERGRKMSKSLGNVVVPGEVLSQYGADALRLALLCELRLTSEKARFEASQVESYRGLLDRLDAALGRLGERAVPANADRRPADALLQDTRRQLVDSVETFRFEDIEAGVRKLLAVVESVAAGRARCDPAVLLQHSLEILHPFAPILTEAHWLRVFPELGLLSNRSGCLSIATVPA